MIHLQALKPFVIYPTSLISKHIKIIRSIPKNVNVDGILEVKNGDFLNIATAGNVGFQLEPIMHDPESFPILVSYNENGVVIRIACINKQVTPIETFLKNLNSVINGLYGDYPNAIAHEAVHLIDMAKNLHLEKDGYDTLKENFMHEVWEEINAFVNEVIYAYPEAINSYETFVTSMMNKNIDYKVSDKKATIKLPNFKPIIESITKG